MIDDKGRKGMCIGVLNYQKSFTLCLHPAILFTIFVKTVISVKGKRNTDLFFKRFLIIQSVIGLRQSVIIYVYRCGAAGIKE